MTYLWRKIAEDRWLYVTDDVQRTIVGGITREGLRRYRIQLPCRGGTLLSQPVIFERFKTAQRILKSKLDPCAASRRKGPVTAAKEAGRYVIAASVER